MLGYGSGLPRRSTEVCVPAGRIRPGFGQAASATLGCDTRLDSGGSPPRLRVDGMCPLSGLTGLAVSGVPGLALSPAHGSEEEQGALRVLLAQVDATLDSET